MRWFLLLWLTFQAVATAISNITNEELKRRAVDGMLAVICAALALWVYCWSGLF